MKLVILSLLLVPALSIAGNDRGGGGHPCKSQAMTLIKSVDDLMVRDEFLTNKYPEWRKMRNVANPKTNPGFVFRVSSTPVQNCMNTDNALACSSPSQNSITLYCGEKGWDTLSLEEQLKHLIHELYWWTDVLDDNYYYSSELAQAVALKIQKIPNYGRKTFVSFEKGDITSASAKIRDISCRPNRAEVREGTSGWKPLENNEYLCVSEKGCSYHAVTKYTVQINDVFIPQTLTQLMTAANNLKLSDIQSACEAQSKAAYKKLSNEWLQKLESINTGANVKAKNSKVSKNSSNTCYNETLEGYVAAQSSELVDYYINTVQCE